MFSIHFYEKEFPFSISKNGFYSSRNEAMLSRCFNKFKPQISCTILRWSLIENLHFPLTSFKFFWNTLKSLWWVASTPSRREMFRPVTRYLHAIDRKGCYKNLLINKDVRLNKMVITIILACRQEQSILSHIVRGTI